MSSQKTMITVLKEIAALMIPATSSYNGLTSYQNLQGEIEDFPIIYIVEPIVSNHEVSAAMNFRTTYPIVLLFGDITALEDSQDSHDVIIYEQRVKAEAYIKELLGYVDPDDGIFYVKEITSIKITNVINVSSSNFSGVQLEMDVEVNEQSKLC